MKRYKIEKPIAVFCSSATRSKIQDLCSKSFISFISFYAYVENISQNMSLIAHSAKYFSKTV